MLRAGSMTRGLLWGAAIAGSFGLHVAIAAGVVQLSREADPEDVAAGSLVVELAPDYMTAPTPATALPIGNLSSETIESAPSAAATAIVPDRIETPPVEKAPEEPAIALREPKPESEESPAEPEPEKPPAENKESAASTASHAAAPVQIQGAREAAKTAAPQVGMSPQSQRAKVTWLRAISVHLERYKRYPAMAGDKRVPGTVRVHFKIDRRGHVTTSEVTTSAGTQRLDEAALEMLMRAQPLPLPPSDVVGDTFDFTVPVVFKLP